MPRKTTTKQEPKAEAKKPTAKATGYQVPDNEKDRVHAEIEQRRFDPVTGERKSKSSTYIAEPAVEWEQFVAFGPRMGIFVNAIHHAPEGYEISYTNPGGEEVTA